MLTIFLSIISFFNSKYTSILIVPLLIVLNIFLILNFSSADLSVYLGQLESGVFYQKEFMFGLLQQFSLSLFSDPRDALTFIQVIYLLLLLTLSFRSDHRKAWVFLVLPVFFLGEFNSLRQGFSAIFVMYGLTSNKKLFRALFFLVAPFFHLSAMFAIFIYYSVFTLNDKFLLKFIIIILTVIPAALFLSDLLLILDKTSYIRDEEFSSSRYGSEFKIIYLSLIGVLLFCERYFKAIQSLGIVFMMMSVLMFILPASDLIFRLSYFLQCYLLYFSIVNPKLVFTNLALSLLLLNPSTYSLIMAGELG